MFARGSRYRNLPESSPLGSDGERLRGKGLRFIPPTPGIFLHTVRDRERLDLLGFKYYGDSTRWWQISDANPIFPFPPDLLDRRPIVAETWALNASNFESRFQNLLPVLAALAPVRLFERRFIGSSVTLSFAAASVRAQAINAIAAGSFRFLRSFAWTLAGSAIETFTFEDPEALAAWRAILQRLRATPGVIDLQSTVVDGMLAVTYNSAMVERDTLLSRLKAGGFDLLPPLSQTFERRGERIVVPPNGIV